MGTRIDLDKSEALINAGQVADAVAVLEKFVVRKPREIRALHLLGVAKSMLGQHQQAAEFLQRARALKPQAVRITTDFAIVLIMLGRNAEAILLLDKVRTREPDFHMAEFYAGIALTNLERHREAVEIFHKLSTLDPDNDLYAQNYAAVLGTLHRYNEAEAIANRLLKKKTSTEALLVKSIAACGRESFVEALELCDQILTRDPMHVEAAHNRGHIRLLTGDLAAGWPDYEARLRRDGSRVAPPCNDVPQWLGEAPAGKSLLVYAEQGLGDIILVCRYLPLLVEAGCEVSFLVPGAMIPILRGASDRVHYIDKVPDGRTFDFQIPMMSLPLRFATSLTTIPSRVPYLFAEPQRVDYWRNVIGGEGFKIGIAWQGNPTARVDLGRSIPVTAFHPLSQISGARLISLQKNHGLEQLDHLPELMRVEQLGSSGSDGFLDTAAVMMNMDLIVTSDTSTANLAGALGLPACVLLKRNPDWRWMACGERTPWFPTLKLFRKDAVQDWPELLQRVAQYAEGQAAGKS
jgi:tetratricopeptide (TPR) repeat protein